MTISWIILSLRVLGPRSQWPVFEKKNRKKNCHRSSPFIYGPILILLNTNVLYDYTKVKVRVAIFRKNNIFIILTPTFTDQFSVYFTELPIMAISWTSLSISI